MTVFKATANGPAVCLCGTNRVYCSGDIAYRYGGEEFVVVLAGQILADAASAMERLRHAVQGLGIPHAASRAGEVMTISVGVSAWEYEQLDTPVTTLARADDALYRSKAAGRNRVTAGVPAPSTSTP